jgi:hypothetical protein
MKRSGTSTYLSEGPRERAGLAVRRSLPARGASRAQPVARVLLMLTLLGLNGCELLNVWRGSSQDPTSNDSPLDKGQSAELAHTLSADDPQIALQPGHINQALEALLAPLPKPLRILTITALPRVVAVQVQNTQNPSEVHQYSYRAGKVDGPQKVKLLGKGSLKDNLFRPPSADPRMAEEALRNVIGQFKHPARKLVMIRNLPESLDIQFRVFLDTPSGELIVAADKHGRVLGPVVAGPSSSTNN